MRNILFASLFLLSAFEADAVLAQSDQKEVKSISLGIPPGALTAREGSILGGVANIVNQYFDGKINPSDLAENSLRGIGAAQDAHTMYLDPESMAALEEAISGNFEGIGVVLNTKHKHAPPRIRWVFPGGPAARVKPAPERGDRIVLISGKSTEELSQNEVIARLRGPGGTAVEIVVEREDGEGRTLRVPVAITRGSVNISNFFSDMAAPGVGYMHLASFECVHAANREHGDIRWDSTDSDVLVLKALRDLKGRGAKSFIIDLRNNPGGDVSVVTRLASAFLKKDMTVLSMRSRASRQELKTSEDGGFSDPDEYPLKVLVNGGSASASEIFAGVMQDHKRARIYGERSFGKGSMQQNLHFTKPFEPGSGVKVTIARWYLPSGRSIDGRESGGIAPDVVSDVDEDTSSYLATQRGERDMGLPDDPDSEDPPSQDLRDAILAAALESR